MHHALHILDASGLNACHMWHLWVSGFY